MKTTSPAACDDLEAATAAAEAEAKTAAAEEQQAPAASKVAVAGEQEGRPALRWAFARRVYAMLSLQFALAAGFAGTAWLVPAVPRFFADGRPRAAVWAGSVAVLASPLIVMLAMLIKLRVRGREKLKHPRNFALFVLSKLAMLDFFTLCCTLCIAVSAFSGTVFFASSTDGIVLVLLQATILTVLGLILFAFWAAKRGYDYINTFSFLLIGLIVVLAYYIIEIPFPLVMVTVVICGLLLTLVFSSFNVIVLDGIGDGG